MQSNDPVITYNHMAEEPGLKAKYFRKEPLNKNQSMLLFFAEEMLILGFLAYLVYLVFV